jgi:hypothetical protein
MLVGQRAARRHAVAGAQAAAEDGLAQLDIKLAEQRFFRRCIETDRDQAAFAALPGHGVL